MAFIIDVAFDINRLNSEVSHLLCQQSSEKPRPYFLILQDLRFLEKTNPKYF